jgi:hypothetical protein
VLRNVIEQQRTAQRAAHAAAVAAGNLDASLVDARPEQSPISFARIVMERDTAGLPEFFVHLSVTMPPMPPQPIPSSVMGVHEHETGYSYAILGLDGQVLRDDGGNELVGDLVVPAHADPYQKARRLTDNYVYEVANAIVRRAGTSLIGMEDTSWRKDVRSLSRTANEKLFRHPSRRIAEVVAYKARLAGLLKPWDVSGVSPTRDCTACLVRLPKDLRGVHRRSTVRCPQCRTACLFSLLAETHRCSTCEHEWVAVEQDVITEEYFLCPVCSAPPRPPRHHSAIAVGQQLLRLLGSKSPKL